MSRTYRPDSHTPSLAGEKRSPVDEKHRDESFADARADALEEAANHARVAPSVHNTQPWSLVLTPDTLTLRADRSRQLTVLDPLGRELVQSVGAALFNARVALAARGWATEVERLPRPDDPDLLASVRPVPGTPDSELAILEGAVGRRRSNRRRFAPQQVPAELVARLASAAAAEEVVLIPVRDDAHRQLVARLTRQADRLQNADPAYRAELRRWTTREPKQGDGVPARAVAHVEGPQHDDIPLRNFDTTGAGGLPAETDSRADQTLVLLATPTDDPYAWLRAGEALERILLELTERGWAVSPVTQPVEVPLTRTQLRSGLTWDAHPQNLLRIGRAAATPSAPRRSRDDVVLNSRRSGRLRQTPDADRATPDDTAPTAHRPVSDGRGGTTWI